MQIFDPMHTCRVAKKERRTKCCCRSEIQTIIPAQQFYRKIASRFRFIYLLFRSFFSVNSRFRPIARVKIEEGIDIVAASLCRVKCFSFLKCSAFKITFFSLSLFFRFFLLFIIKFQRVICSLTSSIKYANLKRCIQVKKHVNEQTEKRTKLLSKK